jgi:hypothetical protein
MAGIDINNVFPASKMAGAAKLGQSQFRSVETQTGGALMRAVQAEPEIRKELEKKPAARK